MHLEHEYESTHSHSHGDEHHTHTDGGVHTHNDHHHDHDAAGHTHASASQCAGGCESCSGCDPMEELIAMMKYMVSHNTAHANELAALAGQLEKAGNHMAYEQVMQAVSDFEKGNLRLSATLAALEK